MAQIFKTISLEERLKNSEYANLPIKPSIIQMPGESPPNRPRRTPLSQTSTVQITPFGIFNHTSNIQVQQFGVYQHISPTQIILSTAVVNQGGIFLQEYDYQPTQGQTTTVPYFFTPTQGGLFPTLINFNPTQGGVLPVPFNYIPVQGSTTIGSWLFAPIQGNTTLGSYLFTLTQGITSLTPYLFSPNQGVTNLTPYIFIPSQGVTNLAVYNYVPNQGITNLTAYLFTPNQGLFTPAAYSFTPNQGLTSLSPYTFIPNQGSTLLLTVPTDVEQGGVVLPLWEVNINQGSIILPIWDGRNGLGSITGLDGSIRQSTESFVQPKLQRFRWTVEGSEFELNPERRHGSAILSVLRYEADRALARLAPEVKHGSADIAENFYSSNEFDQYPTDKKNGSNLTKEQQNTVFGASLFGGSLFQDPNFFEAQNRLDKYYRIMDKSVALHKLNEQPTLTFNQLKESSSNSLKLYSDPLPTSVITSSNMVKSNVYPDDIDFITFEIQSVTNPSKLVRFRAFLTAFNDSLTANWADVNHIGRQETLKTFKGVTRAFSIGFKVAAFNASDIESMYSQLNKLMQIAVVGSATKDNYLLGPVNTITVGNWFKKTLCIFNSIKVDTQPTEYTWDLLIPSGSKKENAKLVPQIVDVSMDGVILTSHQGDDRLNSNSTMLTINHEPKPKPKPKPKKV